MPTWKEICENPKFNDLPYKIELTAAGKIEMSPTRSKHAAYQSRIDRKLSELMGCGEMFVEVAIDTRDSVKVADVAWASEQRAKIIVEEFSCSVAPEICVEVWSPSNTRREIAEKRELYLEAGALEFWYCDKEGTITFYDATGELAASKLCPAFPRSIA